MRRLLIILAAVATLMVAGPPAGAIINGTPDADGHPNVGVMLLSQGDGYNPGLFCSGALLSKGDAAHPAVFLTAGHCVAYLEYQMPADTQVVVSFDSNLNLGPDGLLHPTNVIGVSGWALIPSYFSHGANHRDVGVLFLSAAPGLSPVLLPAVGDDEHLVGKQLTEVGYGLNSLDRGFNSPNANFTVPGQRLTGTEKVSAVTPEWLITHADPNSTCYGDSGGPQFYGVDVVVSLTRNGDAACRSVSSEQRLDLYDVQTWLHDQTG
jgi:hypothetical protein